MRSDGEVTDKHKCEGRSDLISLSCREKSSKRKRKHSRDVKSESTTTSGDSTDSESISEGAAA